ncbi:MAG: hypothetical protein AB7G47_11635 [Mycolicibacterium sp.]|uniref:hypothetical protein n=1 Tax=Mycolicibacterium sp. TaxID=2320850 RepID=UPI003D13E26F
MVGQAHTHAQLLAQLEERIGGLRSAGRQFDQGDPVGARQIATQVRELVHHSRTSTALINRLGLDRQLTWVDTAGVTHPKTVTSSACLTLMKIGGGPNDRGEYIPKLDLYPPVPIRTRDGGRIDRGSRIPFDHWWTNPVVKDPDGADYSRKQLVLALDPAGDIDDAEYKAAYRAVASSRWLAPAVVAGRAAGPATLRANPLLASVRQIGYEVLQTVSQQRDVIDATRGPALVTLAGAASARPSITDLVPDGPVPLSG